MSYEESILAPGEKIVGTFRAHALPGIGFYWGALAGGGAAMAAGLLGGGGGGSILGMGLGAVLIAVWAIKFLFWRNSVLVVTTKRVIKGSGVLAKHTRDSALDKITDLELSQTVLGRVLDYGTLGILTANEKAEDVFPGLSRPKVAKSTLLEAKASLEKGDTGARGKADGDIAAIDRLNQRGLLGDTEARELLAKLIEGSVESQGV